MALDCKKLIGITDIARNKSLAKVNEWMEGRKSAIAQNMVARAEMGFGHADVAIPVNQVLGVTPNVDTTGLAMSVCREAVRNFVGEDAEVSAKANYENIVVTVSWKKFE